MHTQVLIIGGGFAGVSAAQQLEKLGIQTLLVDKKDYFEVTYAVLRDATDPSFNADRGRKRYQDLLHGQFIQTGVSELTDKNAILDNGQVVNFDIAVIASGTRYPQLPLAKSVHALSLSKRNQELHSYHQKLKSSSSVLIIGGGVVGVELAGEIAFAMPHLQVTLAHNGDNLLNGFKPKAQQRALTQLQSIGVEVELNTQYEAWETGYRDAVSGKHRQANLVFSAVGTIPNNDYLTTHLSHILNERGFVAVDQTLSVVGQSNMYAIGDIADVGEAKLGYLASQQGTHLAKQIARRIEGKKVKSYRRNPFMALVPIGQEQGVVQLPFAVTSWKPLINIKQSDLFISKTFRSFAI
ncbi:NAD(P)/FAD-dependent oxidoreductase [Vibrio sp. WXL103]|uniref:NAD(P)/FAD-dependent oxidoreductase n=1 Tax=Vibrio sp. WXL103 TaxID=3450710 RepID=UPI003EC63701